VIAGVVRAHPGEITLVPVGPLTNIALALRVAPDLRTKVREIILMGGSITGGNMTPAAEFNIYSDAEAAKVVFASGIPITMVGLGATAQAILTRAHLAELRASGSPIAGTVARMAEFYVLAGESRGQDGAAMHDPLAVGLAIDRNFAAKIQPMHIDVETKGELTYGETVADRRSLSGGEAVQPNADVPVEVDGDRFLRFFVERITAAAP
jgi:purine nucleosidase